MHIHILGICGTFMGSLALLAKELGYKVSGSDENVYPPMSTQLEAAGIELIKGYDEEQLNCGADVFVIGNAMVRGNPAVEALLNRNLPYISGPQWLAEHVLKDRWVLAVSGTHGKTTTASMLAWLLQDAGLEPGFLIGGVPKNFGVSARLGSTAFFVIEADEYDTAFFDKRSKFVHYRPRTLVINNMEYDHADIFPDLAAIQKQFHHLIRILPSQGLIVTPLEDGNVEAALKQGCWTPVEYLSTRDENSAWYAQPLQLDCSEFSLSYQGQMQGEVRWEHTGRHNMSNGLAAIAAARHVGIPPSQAVDSLSRFEGAKRRMEKLGEVSGVTLYDDFAHHPTAIATTLQGLRNRVGKQRVFAVIEPRSNTMRGGIHKDALAPATAMADRVLWYQPEGVDWQMEDVIAQSANQASLHRSVDEIIKIICSETHTGDQVVIMSNGGFAGIHQKLLLALAQNLAQNLAQKE